LWHDRLPSRPDRAVCGQGFDSVSAGFDEAATDVDADCESTPWNGVSPGGSWVPGAHPPVVRLDGSAALGERALRVGVTCRAKTWPCRGRVAVKNVGSGRRVQLGSARFKTSSAGRKRVRVALSGAAAKRVRRGARVVVLVRVSDGHKRDGGTAREQIVR